MIYITTPHVCGINWFLNDFSFASTQDEGAKDCYEARLIVRGVDGSDSRKYTLNVENERGSEAFAVALEVREPVAMSVVIGIVVGCIILLLIITLVILYLLKAERMCFNRGYFICLDSLATTVPLNCL
ncbi:hemicentin-2 [Trichonephila clavipes]|nr:hemicentin-2 [Trichonephila clavipes]